MLDWQNKKWIKVIAVILVITFISYDIAWAVDFSPLPLFKTTPNFIPKIKDFISKNIFKKPSPAKKPEETEISFRSQLIPSKKYEEDSGFQRLDTVKEMMKRQMEEMQRRQNIEQERTRNIYNQYQINKSIYLQEQQKGQGVQDIQDQLNKARGATTNAAAAGGEFSYALNKDGSRVNYTDGLPSSIENEPITDSYGYKSIKNTKNMRYNNDRLMTSYDAEVIDALGNVTKIQRRNATYSPDSVWWADSTTNAGKYLLSYIEAITDPYGTTNIRGWSTTRDAYNSAKKYTSYHEIVWDALGNISSTIDWSNPTYDGDDLTSYHQITKDSYGNIYTTDWKATYKDHKLISVVSEDSQENLDLSTSKSKTTTNYAYEYDPLSQKEKLASAVSQTVVNGEDIFANFYSGSTDHIYQLVNGELKLVNNVSQTRYDNADGSETTVTGFVEYKYNDKNLMVDAVGYSTAEGLDVFGNRTSSKTIDYYDIIASQARRTASVTFNSSEDIFGSETASESVVEYIYNDVGNLIYAQGYTDTTGQDVFGDTYSTHTVQDYAIINGEARVIKSSTEGNLLNPFSDTGGMLSDLENKLQSLQAMAQPEKESFLKSIGLGNVAIVNLTSAGIATIITWLYKATTKVINCAVDVLYNMLSTLRIGVTKEELAHTALLVDILTGVITPENATGELLLSMYSIIKAAESKGAVLKGARLTFDQLKDMGESVIAHVGGNHYVIVTEIKDGNVKYIDNGKEVTSTVEEFNNIWNGNILTLNLPANITPLPIEELKIIRGAESGAPPIPDEPPGFTRKVPINKVGPSDPRFKAPPTGYNPSNSSELADYIAHGYPGNWNEASITYSFIDTSSYYRMLDGHDQQTGGWIWGYSESETWVITSNDGKSTYEFTRDYGTNGQTWSNQNETWKLKFTDSSGFDRDVRHSKGSGDNVNGKDVYQEFIRKPWDWSKNDKVTRYVLMKSATSRMELWREVGTGVDGSGEIIDRNHRRIRLIQKNKGWREDPVKDENGNEIQGQKAWAYHDSTSNLFLDREGIGTTRDIRYYTKTKDNNQTTGKTTDTSKKIVIKPITEPGLDGANQEIWVDDIGEESTSSIHAMKFVADEGGEKEKGVREADVYSGNTSKKKAGPSISFAKVVRFDPVTKKLYKGNGYHVYGINWMLEGLATGYIKLDRELGKPDGGIIPDTKTFNVFRNDFDGIKNAYSEVEKAFYDKYQTFSQGIEMVGGKPLNSTTVRKIYDDKFGFPEEFDIKIIENVVPGKGPDGLIPGTSNSFYDGIPYPGDTHLNWRQTNQVSEIRVASIIKEDDGTYVIQVKSSANGEEALGSRSVKYLEPI
ncbi:MAG: cysteine peptidase family C39 domain-containing protein, partial [Candidatus Omnitrophota bacterium]